MLPASAVRSNSSCRPVAWITGNLECLIRPSVWTCSIVGQALIPVGRRSFQRRWSRLRDGRWADASRVFRAALRQLDEVDRATIAKRLPRPGTSSAGGRDRCL